MYMTLRLTFIYAKVLLQPKSQYDDPLTFHHIAIQIYIRSTQVYTWSLIKCSWNISFHTNPLNLVETQGLNSNIYAPFVF